MATHGVIAFVQIGHALMPVSDAHILHALSPSPINGAVRVCDTFGVEEQTMMVFDVGHHFLNKPHRGQKRLGIFPVPQHADVLRTMFADVMIILLTAVESDHDLIRRLVKTAVDQRIQLVLEQ